MLQLTKLNNKVIYLDVDSIEFLEEKEEYTVIHFKSGKTTKVLESANDVGREAKDHKDYIVLMHQMKVKGLTF